MDLAQIISNIISFFSNPDAFVKIALILLLLLFLLFAIIFYRQISHMLTLVNQVSFSPILKLAALSLIGFTLIILIAVIFV